MMSLKLVRKEGNKAVIELEGEDHTMANLIAKYLIRVEGVKYAAYHIPHPLTGQPIIRIVTDGNVDPVDALEKALNMILNDLRELREKLREAIGVEERG